jgi:hypothetical protein
LRGAGARRLRRHGGLRQGAGARLDATIVDDYNQPLSDAALTEIAGQVQDFYNEMNDADIPAGSARALRLFS